MSLAKEDSTTTRSLAKHVVDGSVRPAKSATIGVESSAKRTSLKFGSVLAHVLQIPCLIWAFTESNFITFVLPNTAFGILSALAGQKLLQMNAGASQLTSAAILRRTPLAIAFNWANVLVFDRGFP